MLCDVLGWAAAEAAELLGGTTASINSALQRARETLSKRYPDGRPQTMTKPNPAQLKLLGRYVKAWETLDIDGFVSLLKEDATYTMPPLPQWYAGREAIRTFFAFAFGFYASIRMMPTDATQGCGLGLDSPFSPGLVPKLGQRDLYAHVVREARSGALFEKFKFPN